MRCKVALLLLLLAVAVVASAQADRLSQPQPLAFDDPVYGVLEPAQPPAYTFTGSVDMLIAISLRSVDRTLNNPLHTPVLLLHGPDGARLVDTTAQVASDDVTLLARLPAAGAYTVRVVPDATVAAPARGPFTLTLHQLTVHEPGETLRGVVTAGEGPAYHALQAVGPLRLTYSHDGGDLRPQVSAGRINAQHGGLDVITSVYGPRLSYAVLGGLAPDEPVIVRVQQHPQDYVFFPVEAAYRLIVSGD
ncbi:MAG: hypothetical protein ACOCXZ_01420 [Chloroflexota bacterium]